MQEIIDTNKAMTIEKPIYFDENDDIVFAAPPRIAAAPSKTQIVDCGICLLWCNSCNRNTVHESGANGFTCTEC